MQRPPAPGPPGSQARPQGFAHPQGYGGPPGYGMYPPGQAPQYPPMHGPNMYMTNPGHPGMQGPAYGYPPHPAGGVPYYPGPMPPQSGYGMSHGPAVGQAPPVAGRPPVPVGGAHNVVPTADGVSHPSSSVPPPAVAKVAPPSVHYRPDEVEYYNNLFKEADVEGFGRIQGKEAVAFLSKSHLPKPTLKNIWELADYHKQFFLTSAEFFVAMRLISLAQMGREMSLSAVESSTNMPLPKFENIRTSLPEKAPAVSQSTPASKTKPDIFDAFADLAPAVAEAKVELSAPVAPSTTGSMSGGPTGGPSHGTEYQHHTGVLPNTGAAAAGPSQQQFMYQQQQHQQYQQQQQHSSPYHPSMAPSPPMLGNQQQQQSQHRSVTPPPSRGPFAPHSANSAGSNPFQQPSPSTGFSVSQPFAQMHQTSAVTPVPPQAHAVQSTMGFMDSTDDFGDFSSAVPTAPHIPTFATTPSTSSALFSSIGNSGGAGHAMPMEPQRFQTPPLKPMTAPASQPSPAVDFNSMMEMSFKGVAGQSVSPRTAPASGTTTTVVPPLHLGAVSGSSTKPLSPAISRETSPRALPKIAESGPVKTGYTSTPFESSTTQTSSARLDIIEPSSMTYAPKPSPTKPAAPLQDRMSAFDDLLEPEPVVSRETSKFRAESDDFTDFQSSAPVPSQSSTSVPSASKNTNTTNSTGDLRNRQVSFAAPSTGMLSEPFASSFPSTDFKHRDSIEFDDFQGAAITAPPAASAIPTAPTVSVHSSNTSSTNSFNPFMSGSGVSSTYLSTAPSIMDDFDFGDPISAAPVVPVPAVGATTSHDQPVIRAEDVHTRKMEGATLGGEAFNPFFQATAPVSARVSAAAPSPPPPPPASASASLYLTDNSFNAPPSTTQPFEEDDFGDFASASPSPDISPRELPTQTVSSAMPEPKRELSAENAFSDFMSTSSSSQPKSPRIVPVVSNRSVSPKFTPAAAPSHPPPPSVTLSDAMSAFDDLVESAPTPTITMPSLSFSSEPRAAPPPPPPPAVNVSLAPFSSLAGQKPVFPTLTVSTSVDSVKSRTTSSDEWDAFASALPVSSVPVSHTQSTTNNTGGAATSLPKPISSPALSDFDFEFAAPMPSSLADSHGGSPTSPSDFDMMFSMSPTMPSTAAAASVSFTSPGPATKPSSVPLPAAAGDDMLFGDFASSTPNQSPMGTAAAGAASVGTTDTISLFDLDIPPPAEFTRSNDYRYVSEQVLLKCEEELQQAVQHMTQVRNGHRDIRPKVMAHPKMAVFLQGIREVYRLSCRIFDTANKLSGTILPPHLAQPASAQHWKSLKDLTTVCSSEAAKYLDIDVKNEPKMNSTQGTDQICSLCLLGVVQPPPPPSMLTSLFKKEPVVVQDKSLAPVHLQGCLYHSSCINFWLHRVSMDPPNIKQHAAH